MALNLVFSVLAVSVAVLAQGPPQGGPGGPQGGPPQGGPGGRPFGGPGGPPQGGPGGPGGPGLPFLANLTADERKAFDEVFRNENLTLSEIDTQIDALAEKDGVSDEYKEFQANQTARQALIKKNVTEVIGKLSSVGSQLETIFSNKDQTRQEQREAVEALRKENPLVVDVLQFIRSHLEGGPRRGPGGPGGPQGGPGGPQGGPGGPQRGPQGGQGPQQGPPQGGPQ